MFSCRTRGFCPSCHAKRIEEWGEWMRESLLLDVIAAIQTFGDRMNLHPHLERLFFLESGGKVGYRYGEKGAEQETMDYLEFIARSLPISPTRGR
jgi:hypothetical protein